MSQKKVLMVIGFNLCSINKRDFVLQRSGVWFKMPRLKKVQKYMGLFFINMNNTVDNIDIIYTLTLRKRFHISSDNYFVNIVVCRGMHCCNLPRTPYNRRINKDTAHNTQARRSKYGS